jgi:hypothetical protein
MELAIQEKLVDYVSNRLVGLHNIILTKQDQYSRPTLRVRLIETELGNSTDKSRICCRSRAKPQSLRHKVIAVAAATDYILRHCCWCL